MLYLIRRDALNVNKRDKRLDWSAPPLELGILVPGLGPGQYEVNAWDTVAGALLSHTEQTLGDGHPVALPPLVGDLAVAIRRVP